MTSTDICRRAAHDEMIGDGSRFKSVSRSTSAGLGRKKGERHTTPTMQTLSIERDRQLFDRLSKSVPVRFSSETLDFDATAEFKGSVENVNPGGLFV